MLLSILWALLMPADPDYLREVEQWRAQQELRLKSDTGWLTWVGLHWLKPGDNSVGVGQGYRVPLPPGAGACSAILRLQKDSVTLEQARGVKVNGKTALPAQQLASDKAGRPDVLSCGTASFFLIRRGSRLGVRVRDTASELRRRFRSRVWFAVDEGWRIEGHWVPYPAPQQRGMNLISGDTEPYTVTGYVSFLVHGREFRFEAQENGDELFIVFRDKTAGRDTYPGGRFLDTRREDDGRVVLDFNKAYNPACAFTPHSTCPIPPPSNVLPVEIPAGEKYPPLTAAEP